MARYTNFKLPPTAYTVGTFGKSHVGYEEALAEYKRLKKTALQSIRRLEKAGYGQYRNVKKYRQILSEAKPTPETIAFGLHDVSTFLSQNHTVTAYRKMDSKTMEMLERRGIDISRENLARFYDALELIRDSVTRSQYESEQAVETAAYCAENGLSDRDVLNKYFGENVAPPPPEQSDIFTFDPTPTRQAQPRRHTRKRTSRRK